MKSLKTFILLVLLPAALALHAQIQGNWSLIGPVQFPTNIVGQINGMGRVSQIKFHPTNPNIMYAVSATGGLWISNNTGATWNHTGTDNLAQQQFASICIDYTNDSILYLGGGDANYYSHSLYAIQKSTDGGQTWAPASNTIGNRLVVEILMSPLNHNVLIAATNDGIFKSADAAATWVEKVSTGDFTDMVFKPVQNTAIIYAVTHSKIYRSQDMGDTWSELTNGDTIPNNDGQGMRLAVTPADTNRIYVGMIANRGNVLRSDDGGDSWRTVKDDYSTSIVGYAPDQDGQGNYDFTMIADPRHADWLFLSAECHWRSLDGGYTWQKLTDWWVNCHTDMHCYAFNPANPNQLFNANDGGVWMSDDTANNWVPKSSMLSNTEFYHAGNSMLQRGYINGGTQDNGELYMGFGTWYTNRGGDWGSRVSFDYLSSSYCYENSEGTRRGLTGGETNLELPFTPDNSVDFEFTPDMPNVAFVSQNDVWRTDSLSNNPPHWTQISNINAPIQDIASVPGHPQILYAVTNAKRVYRTDNALDASPSWSQVGTLPNGTNVYACIAPVKSDTNVVYISGNGKIYRSANMGANFTSVTANLPSANIQKLIADNYSTDESLYLQSGNTVYYKNVGMGNWLNYSFGLPTNAGINDMMMFNDGTPNSALRVAFFGRGIWETPLYASPVCPPTDSLFATNITISTAMLHWNAAGNGSYVLQYKNADSINWNTVSIATNSYAISGLLPDTRYAFRVQCTCNGGSQSGFSLPANFTTGCEPVPAQWNHRDIGQVQVPGDVCYHPATQTYIMKGSGADIWDYNDECHYMYQRIAGDCRITAKCESIDAVYEWSKAGVMIRETLDSSARQVMMAITPGNGAAFHYRPNDPSYTYNTNDTSFHAPLWLRLTRIGNTFVGSVSPDSITWTDIDNTVMAMADTFYIGIVHTSHVNAVLSQSVFHNIDIYPPTSVIGGVIQPVAPKTAVSIFPNPANGQVNISVTLTQASQVNMVVYNATGQVVYSINKNLSAGTNTLSINTTHYPPGAYLLNIVANERTVSSKFIIER